MFQQKMKLRRHSVLHLKAYLRFHFREHLKLHGPKVDGPLANATKSAPEDTLKLHLRIHLAIYI